MVKLVDEGLSGKAARRQTDAACFLAASPFAGFWRETEVDHPFLHVFEETLVNGGLVGEDGKQRANFSRKPGALAYVADLLKRVVHGVEHIELGQSVGQNGVVDALDSCLRLIRDLDQCFTLMRGERGGSVQGLDSLLQAAVISR